ncbi:hypothetical protein ABT317_27270 [Streptomyces carpinensis]|uniref:Uncharacterized protein n=1 Tax=Streptomyces carpinensis TaxID=66369 RepID=A0ABV1W8T6_9ACTN
MTGTGPAQSRWHVPDREQARCCALGSISVALVNAALRRQDPVAAVHAEVWRMHFVDAHPDRELRLLPGCAGCLESAASDGGGGLPAVEQDRVQRLHLAQHLLLPTPLVSFAEPA